VTTNGETGRPEILDTGTEKELLYSRARNQVLIGLSAVRQDITVADAADAIAGMAVTGVLSALRTMSGRQLAVLLAQEANRHAGYVIHEPPRYPPEEIAEVF
jgi:hypothetical protein